MGEAKRRRRMAFPETMIRAWEDRDCVDFAVALARVTGWLLHVDWAADRGEASESDPAETEMIPLRVYVGDDQDLIFDVRGIKRIQDFNACVIGGLAMERRPTHFQNLGVASRTYDEARLSSLPLRFAPGNEGIASASEAIKANAAFLAAIPERPHPRLPAKIAADFTWGRCAVYARALEDVSGLQAVALCVDQLRPQWGGMQMASDGYLHSLCLHDDGSGEDSWGRQPIERIAERFGAMLWRLDRERHLTVVEQLMRNSPDQWEAQYRRAREAIESIRAT